MFQHAIANAPSVTYGVLVIATKDTATMAIVERQITHAKVSPYYEFILLYECHNYRLTYYLNRSQIDLTGNKA